MYIVIAGSGRVGAALACSLSADGHNVVVVDREAEAFANLGGTFNGVTIQGNAIDEDVLRAAGIEQADGFAAATSRDSANIMAAEIAQTIFRVPRVVARVSEPARLPAFRDLALNTVCGTELSAELMAGVLLAPGVAHRAFLGGGEVAVVEVVLGPAAAGLALADLEELPNYRLAAVARAGRTFVPDADFVAEEGDTLSYAVLRTALGDLVRRLDAGTREGGR